MVSGNISVLFSKPISSRRLVFSAENDLCNVYIYLLVLEYVFVCVI